MDKIQKLHKKLGHNLHAQLCPEAHAAITDDMMGRFAEWKDINGWVYMKSEKVFLNNDGPLTPKTTSELIRIFKKTL